MNIAVIYIADLVCVVVIMSCCTFQMFTSIRFSISQEMMLRSSPKWSILCWVRCKALTESITTYYAHFQFLFNHLLCITVFCAGSRVRLKKKHSVKDVRRYFFSQRVINRWNSLDQETVDVGSINSFKGRLDKIRKTRWVFMDSAWSAKP